MICWSRATIYARKYGFLKSVCTNFRFSQRMLKLYPLWSQKEILLNTDLINFHTCIMALNNNSQMFCV